jgi:hypothetical protein
VAAVSVVVQRPVMHSQAFVLFDHCRNRVIGAFDDHLKCFQMLPVFVHLLVASLLELQEVGKLSGMFIHAIRQGLQGCSLFFHADGESL